jgi:N utilization substance protein B
LAFTWLYCMLLNASKVFYQEYMSNVKLFWRRQTTYSRFVYGSIVPNEKLYRIFRDDKLTWIDDIPMVNTHIIKQLKAMKPRG